MLMVLDVTTKTVNYTAQTDQLKFVLMVLDVTTKTINDTAQTDQL